MDICGYYGVKLIGFTQVTVCCAVNVTHIRDDYKFSEMIGQKPLIATLAPNLIGHPYIALERQCISVRTLSKMVWKMSDHYNHLCTLCVLVS